jgi:hypothetical protein
MHDGMAGFRRRVERHFGGPAGRGGRYPEELRSEAVSLARAAMDGGASLGSVAVELGVGAGTLSRWLEAPSARSWRAVEVVAEPEVAAVSPVEPFSSPGLVLITSRGHRLEGLSLDEATALLEALG